jgi:tRNA1(Val) A37 N6-methylase TrmN6
MVIPLNNSDTTLDHLLNGQVALEQPRDGYRVAIDPVFLAAAVPAKPHDKILELGLGTGAAALCLLSRVPEAYITGIEIDDEMARLAKQNADRNDVAQKLHIIVGNILSPPTELRGGFDHVMMNPPYLEDKKFSVSPSLKKTQAHHEGEADLAAFVKIGAKYLASGGTLTLIHRADRRAEILSLLSVVEIKMGGIVVYPLWPGLKPDGTPKEAKRILVQASRDSQVPFRLAAGLVLHNPQGGYTSEAEAILRGGSALLL